MPIYEYYCPRCQIEFELRFSFGQSSDTTRCPKCDSESQRLISSFACKTGGSIQATEKPFRKEKTSVTNANREASASPPAKKSIRPRRKPK